MLILDDKARCVAVCCSVWQCVAVYVVCCSVLQYVALCCSMLQCVAVCCTRLQSGAGCRLLCLREVAVGCNCRRVQSSSIRHIRCSTLQCVAVYCRLLQHVAACCSVSLRVAVYRCVLPCVRIAGVCNAIALHDDVCLLCVSLSSGSSSPDVLCRFCRSWRVTLFNCIIYAMFVWMISFLFVCYGGCVLCR